MVERGYVTLQILEWRYETPKPYLRSYEFPTVTAPKFTVVLETVNARYNELATPREFAKFYQNKILKSSERKSMMDKIGKLLGDMDKLSGVFNITLSTLQTTVLS